MVSIIIPMYNAAKTIRLCLDSILQQSYGNYEVIMVDDGSADETEQVCKEYVNSDARFLYFWKENAGVSAARNFGLEKAQGDWVTFVDADDWIAPDMLSFMVSKSKDVDIVGLKPVFDRQESSIKARMSCEFINKEHFSSISLAVLVPEASKFYDGVDMSIEIVAAVCGKLVRKSFIDKIGVRFKEELPLGEDGLFWLQCYLHAKDFLFFNKTAYHYVLSDASSNYKFRPDILNINKTYYDAYMKEYPNISLSFQDEYRSLVIYRTYCNLRNLFLFHQDSPLTWREKRGILKTMLATKNVGIIPYLSISKKIELYLMCCKQSFLLMLFARFVLFLKTIIKKYDLYFSFFTVFVFDFIDSK